MLASLARSHKGGIGKLAEMTDIYLRDAKFTGEDAGFVIREMFERGVFGFIPYMLLEMYQGKEYRALGISEQTEMVKALGMERGRLSCGRNCGRILQPCRYYCKKHPGRSRREKMSGRYIKAHRIRQRCLQAGRMPVPEKCAGLDCISLAAPAALAVDMRSIRKPPCR